MDKKFNYFSLSHVIMLIDVEFELRELGAL